MPLGELIRYFNATVGSGDSTLYDEGGRIAAWHDGMRLGSRVRQFSRSIVIFRSRIAKKTTG
jgi:hypothetical protein